MSDVSRSWTQFPANRRRQVEALLEPGESPVAWLETDLDDRLHYQSSWVVVTDRRLVGTVPTQPGEKTESNDRVSSWPLAEDLTLVMADQAGVGSLELMGPTARLARWRFTVPYSGAAGRFAHRFEEARSRRLGKSNGQSTAEGGTVCPSCGAILTAEQTECPACAPVAPNPSRSLKRLVRFARHRQGLIFLGFVLTLASTAAGLIPPYLTIPLLDQVLIPLQNGEPVQEGLLYWYLGGLAGAAILAWLLSWARTFVLAYVSERVAGDLRDQTYAHLQKLSLEFFGGKRTGDLISRVSSDTDRICQFLSINLVDILTDSLMIVLTAAILLYIDPFLAVVTLVPFPAIAWLIHRVRAKLRHGFARGSSAWSNMVSVLADTIPGIRVVKAFAQEQREVDRFHTANETVIDVNVRVNKTWAFFGPMVTLLTELGLLVIWVTGAQQVAAGRITVGQLTAFLAYSVRFYTRLESMSRLVAAVQRAGAATHRIFEILDRIPSVSEPEKAVHPGRLRGEIELRNVQFRYGRRPVIKGVSFKVAEGEMIGLVGPSGAGKSTLVNLVCRFYDVQEGAILADGVDIRSFPVEEYRRNIGIVLQDPFLFYGSIAENISYGRPEATRGDIIAAARAAHAHEFILRLPDGYDSLVGERGQSLSGGERQRISIARALLTDPRILILDEATSSVDTETEREIQQALENLIQGRTTIAIAHRLSTLRRADRLVVVEQGQVSEMGSHDELLEKNGAYARLHHAQMQMVEKVGI